MPLVGGAAARAARGRVDALELLSIETFEPARLLLNKRPVLAEAAAPAFFGGICELVVEALAPAAVSGSKLRAKT